MRVTEQAQFNRTVSTIKRNYNEMEASQTRLSTGETIMRWKLLKLDYLLVKGCSTLTRMLLQLSIQYIIEQECHQLTGIRII